MATAANLLAGLLGRHTTLVVEAEKMFDLYSYYFFQGSDFTCFFCNKKPLLEWEGF
mgnify:CR=1 FL=1